MASRDGLSYTALAEQWLGTLEKGALVSRDTYWRWLQENYSMDELCYRTTYHSFRMLVTSKALGFHKRGEKHGEFKDPDWFIVR